MFFKNEPLNVSFKVDKGSDSFTLNLKFEDKKEGTSYIKFTAEKNKTDDEHFKNYLSKVYSTGGCTDVQPINGVYQKNLIKSIFKNGVVKDIQSQLHFLESQKEEKKYAKVFVLDVKDSKGDYESIEDIEKAEKEVMSFFQNKEPKENSARKDVHKIIKENDINHFFCESKLKYFLIKNIFSPQQGNYFQHQARGKELLCQISEIFLNGFKLGYSIRASKNNEKSEECILQPANFLALIGKEKTVDSKIQESESPSLYTLYPPHYKTLYGTEEEYYTALKQGFNHMEHRYDEETETTGINIKFN